MNEAIDYDKINWDESGFYDDIAALIKKDCKPWLSETKGKPGFRAVRHPFKNQFLKRSLRSDRRPLSSDEQLHKIADKAFRYYFGWNARSNALFLMGTSDVPPFYGTNVYAVFPIGKFKYVWSQRNYDFLNVLGTLKREYEDIKRSRIPVDTELDFYKRRIHEIIKEYYQDVYLHSALNRHYHAEVMVNCKEYYLIAEDLWWAAIKMRM